VALKARDVGQLSAFYVNVLGLDEIRRFEDDGGLRAVWLHCGESVLMLERSEVAEGGDSAEHDFFSDPPGLHLIALTIVAKERERWRGRLEKHGFEVAHETSHTLYFRDPEGNRLGLTSWPD
jgi:catechol-2,3-dioxygenase